MYGSFAALILALSYSASQLTQNPSFSVQFRYSSLGWAPGQVIITSLSVSHLKRSLISRITLHPSSKSSWTITVKVRSKKTRCDMLTV